MICLYSTPCKRSTCSTYHPSYNNNNIFVTPAPKVQFSTRVNVMESDRLPSSEREWGSKNYFTARKILILCNVPISGGLSWSSIVIRISAIENILFSQLKFDVISVSIVKKVERYVFINITILLYPGVWNEKSKYPFCETNF